MNQDYTRAYTLGQQAANLGIPNILEMIGVYWDKAKYYTHTEMVFAEAGLLGEAVPYPVTGWRYGHIPECGVSWNYRDMHPEAGVSLMAVDGGGETQDKVSAIFMSEGRPVIKVSGLLHTYKTGSDGEPLLLDAVEMA